MSYHKCKYKDTCEAYQRDSIKCQFADKICLHRIDLEEMERLTDVHLSPKGIEECLSDAKLFEISQENQDKQFKEESLK
jgi:hypothetical protein